MRSRRWFPILILVAGMLTTFAILAGYHWFGIPGAIVVVGLVSGASLASVWAAASKMESDAAYQFQELRALIQLQALAEPTRPLPRFGGHALSAHRAWLLWQLVADRMPENVVEFGSGSSTVLIAMQMRKLGCGRLVSFEHDARFAEVTRRNLALHGLEDHACVVDAPLVDVDVDGTTQKWYRVDPAALPESVDLLFVDGPPRKTSRLARYPALPFLRNRMHKGSVVVLDDAMRKEEREILDQWMRMVPSLRHDFALSDPNMAVLNWS